MGIATKTTPRLVEVTSLPVIYVDDMGKLIIDGGNARATYIEYRLIGSERVMMPVVEIVRPLKSIQPDRMARLILEQTGESPSSKAH